MKKTIVTLILISIFSYLTVVAVSALSEEDNELVTESISKLTNIQTQLGSSSSTRNTSRLINSAIKIFTRAIFNPNPSCSRRVEISLLKLDRAIESLSKGSCEVSKRRNCIQDNLINQVVPEFQGAIDNLKKVTALDENGNGVIDVCEDDPDGDGLAGKKDNCPLVSNPEQKDVDGNRIGDACDLFYCCEDSSLTVPLENCPKKTIKSCREEGNVVVGCLAPLKGMSKSSAGGTFSNETILFQSTNGNTVNFAADSMIIINTGFFPFDNSNGVLIGFNDFNCQDLNLVFTPPPGFPGGTFEVGPAANGFETGPRTPGVIGPDGINIMLNNFPIIDPATGQHFDPQSGDQLGLSLFTNDPVFGNSFFDVFVDLDFNGNCVSPLSTSSGGSTTSSGGTVVTTTSSGGSTSSSGGITTMVFGTSSGSLQDAISMSTIPGMTYMATTYDCDDFANDLQQELSMAGFNSTFTAIWRDGGMTGHAVTDVHPTTSSGGIIFVEPQTGMVINLDETMDGMVTFSDNMHSNTFMANEGMSQVEVYMTRTDAGMAGVPVD